MPYDYDKYKMRRIDWKFLSIFLAALFGPALLLGLARYLA